VLSVLLDLDREVEMIARALSQSVLHKLEKKYDLEMTMDLAHNYRLLLITCVIQISLIPAYVLLWRQ
jgi:hypothetical protein